MRRVDWEDGEDEIEIDVVFDLKSVLVANLEFSEEFWSGIMGVLREKARKDYDYMDYLRYPSGEYSLVCNILYFSYIRLPVRLQPLQQYSTGFRAPSGCQSTTAPNHYESEDS